MNKKQVTPLFLQWNHIILITVIIVCQLIIVNTSRADPVVSELKVGITRAGSVIWSGDVVANQRQGDQLGGSNPAYTYPMQTTVGTASSTQWGQVDGKWGIIVAPGILMTLEGTTEVSVSQPKVSATYRFSINWSEGQGAVPSAYSQYAKYGTSSTTPWDLQAQGGSSCSPTAYPCTPKSQGSLKAKLYLGRNVSEGAYTIPKTTVTVGNGYGGVRMPLVVFDGTMKLTVQAPLSCSISAPPAIDFGIVHGFGAKENSFLAQKTGDLAINCTANNSTTATASAKVQVLGEALSSYKYILPLKNDNGELAPGEIRGWLNRAPTNTCSGGASSTNGLIFGDSSQWYDTETLKVGSNKIPYVFNLCGSGKNKVSNLGPASATATINISWD